MAAGTETEVRELSTTDQALMTAITKAEFDQAVTAAHAHPRSVKKFLDECRQLATLDKDIAEDCMYALPRREGGEMKTIEGPSARLAEIVAHAWGNCRIGARVVDEGRDFITAQGVFQDLEKNVHITYEVRRRITKSDGRRYSSDMIGVTGNAACSIALRNAVFKGVPKAFWEGVYQAARKVAVGDAKTLVAYRAEMMERLQKLGAHREMVFTFLNVKGIEDITLDHLATLRGLGSAIKEGELTVENAFKPKDDAPAAAGTTRVDAAKDALRTGNGEATATNGTSANTGAAAVDKESGYIPQFDAKTAEAELRKAKTSKALNEARSTVWKDFKDSSRDVPMPVEAAYHEMAESLRLKEAKV